MSWQIIVKTKDNRVSTLKPISVAYVQEISGQLLARGYTELKVETGGSLILPSTMPPKSFVIL